MLAAVVSQASAGVSGAAILAGGAVAVVSGLVTTYALRLSAVGADVRRHDRRARALDQDLEYWVMDDHHKLQREIHSITADHNARGTLHSGMALADVAAAKTRALHRFRDRRAETERAFADMLAEESWPHELYRRWKRCATLESHAPERVDPVIENWRASTGVPGMTDTAPVYDPTRATLEQLIEQLAVREQVEAAAP